MVWFGPCERRHEVAQRRRLRHTSQNERLKNLNRIAIKAYRSARREYSGEGHHGREGKERERDTGNHDVIHDLNEHLKTMDYD